MEANPEAPTPTPVRTPESAAPTTAIWKRIVIAVPTQEKAATPTPAPTPVVQTPATIAPTPAGMHFLTPTPPWTPTPTPTPTITPVPEVTVPLALETLSDVVRTGQEFEIAVKVSAGYARPVDTAQVYLDFDPAILEVVAIRPGPHLEYLLQSSSDNDRGRLAYAAGTLGNPLEFPFTLARVVFRARTPTVRGSTLIQFDDLRPPRQSKAIHQGRDITGVLGSTRVTVR